MNKRTHFNWHGEDLLVEFVETTAVKTGVECDVYQFVGYITKDLGIIRATSGSSTPLQRVVRGIRTIEGFLEGSGTLTTTDADGHTQQYTYPDEHTPAEVAVMIGQTMQWQATSDLTCYEICEPPYTDGRYEDLSEPHL